MPVLSPAAPISPFQGSRFTQLATPSRGSTHNSVWQIDLQPGCPAAPHQVTAEEIFIVLAGEATVALADTITTAVAGDAIVVPADTDFALSNSGNAPLRLICVLPVGGEARTPDGAVFTPPWAQ
jgi:quercetin dioxygenase-like cupin family protein